MRIITALSVSFLTLAASLPASALKASQEVLSEKVVIQADGTERMMQVKSEMFKPGDRLVYVLNIENDGAKAASNFVITMPVPQEVKYLAGTAESAQALVTYSADGGTSFARREDLNVMDKLGNTVPASDNDISHIRWKVTTPLNAGEHSALLYKGVLR